MIADLRQASDRPLERVVPLCLVGGGTAGLFLAQRLRGQGFPVLVLEAGSGLARTPAELGQHCEQRGIPYRGADQGRSFGLGGTSVLWGGQMIPLTPADMGARPAVGIDAWPIGFETLEPFIQGVKHTLELGADDVPDNRALIERRFPGLSALDPDFQLRLSTWLPFGKRNFAKAFGHRVQSDAGLEVWLNASVVRLEWSHDSGERIVGVYAQSPNGRSLVVRPEVLVVCAGALESTRLLLELDDASAGLLRRSGAPLGRYFSDHLSVTCGRFECRDWRRYNQETAPIFVSGAMRTPRLELSASAQRRLGVTSAFAHFPFVTHGDTGFDVVRDLLRRRQGESRPLGLTPQRLGRAVGDVTAMAYWRSVHRRLWVPRLANLLLHVDIEQVPNPSSLLGLSDERDESGRRRLLIDWRITPEDVRVIRTVADRTIQVWERSPLRDVARLRLTIPERLDDFESLYDVYHPTGTLRMGNSPSTSVVDPDLRVWALDNLYVASTAVFPSAGSANPGLMHLALTDRLADHIAAALARGWLSESS